MFPCPRCGLHVPVRAGLCASPSLPLSLPPQREFVIGRHASCDLCFDHASVSKMHCKIIFSDGIYIQDLRWGLLLS